MKNPRVTGRLWLCLTALVASWAAAGTPEEVVTAYMAALKEHGAES